MTEASRILIVAGSDSGGGAGIQADIKTITTLGGYATTAITAITAQNTLEVAAIHPIPPDMVAQQMRVVLEDIGADVIKTGMLLDADIIEAVAVVLADYPEIPVVVDPVMVASSGAELLQPEAVQALKKRILPGATLITPNIPEAELLAGMEIHNVEDMKKAGEVILHDWVGANATILLKGGHLAGEMVMDLLMAADGMKVFESKRINSDNTHGTGCTLASAIAVGMAQEIPLEEAVKCAREYVRQAILQAPGLGRGQGALGMPVRAEIA